MMRRNSFKQYSANAQTVSISCENSFRDDQDARHQFYRLAGTFTVGLDYGRFQFLSLGWNSTGARLQGKFKCGQ